MSPLFVNLIKYSLFNKSAYNFLICQLPFVVELVYWEYKGGKSDNNG